MWDNTGIWNLMAAVTAPEQLRTNAQSMLWLLPLTAAVAAVYKATKLPEIKWAGFAKETIILSVSIIGFVVVAAIALYVAQYLILQ